MVFCLFYVVENEDDRREIQQPPNQVKRNQSYADDMRVLSALSFVLGGTFLSMFNGFMTHNLPSCSMSGFNEFKKSYVVLATTGFMMLFSAGLLCYEFFVLFRDKRIRDVNQQWKYLKYCYVFVSFGIIVSFASHSISLYLIQCKVQIFYTYLIPLALVFLITLGIIGIINHKYG